MERITCKPRQDWQKIVESQGFLWHSVNNNDEPYWTENAAYRLTAAEVDEIEKATYALNDMCLEAVQYIIDKRDDVFNSFEIYEWVRPIIIDAWKNEEFTVFGRFDFSYDGKNPPKLLEYNADTPTGLVEQAVVQWYWLQDMITGGNLSGDNFDQFNSTHERLIEIYRIIRQRVGMDETMHFTSLPQGTALEDYVTVNYLRDTAIQAGWDTNYLPIEELGWNEDSKTFRDQNENVIKFLTKLYPWEWMVEEQIGEVLAKTTKESRPRFWEPPWKALLSNKAILVLLYEMFPKSPYLLKASYEADDMGKTYVKKPQFGREGANITVVNRGNIVTQTDGEYGDTDLWVYQDFAPLPEFDGNRPVIGSWVVNGYATGIGVRESDNLVTQNLSRFVPHFFNNDKPGFLSRFFS